METKINVYVITGFLGSGKTTVLNNLLEQVNHYKNIVIENEFGKINIDATLIQGKVDGVFELTNGCICCSISDQLLTTLQSISALKVKPDNLFIETTGIADAGEIGAVFKSFYVDKTFQLKKIICVVDALNIESYIHSNIEIQKQIIASNVIVLNKIQNIQTEELDKIEKLIRSIHFSLPIINSNDGNVDFVELQETEDCKININKTELILDKVEHKIKTVLFETNSSFKIQQLKYELFKNLYLYYSQIYRIKGYVKDYTGQVYLVQSVGKSSSVEPVGAMQVSKSQLVVIGRDIELKSIERILKPSIETELKLSEV